MATVALAGQVDDTTLLLQYLNWPANLYATVNGLAMKLDIIDAMLPRDYHAYWLYHDDAPIGTTYVVYQPVLNTFQVFTYPNSSAGTTYLAEASITAPV